MQDRRAQQRFEDNQRTDAAERVAHGNWGGGGIFPLLAALLAGLGAHYSKLPAPPCPWYDLENISILSFHVTPPFLYAAAAWLLMAMIGVFRSPIAARNRRFADHQRAERRLRELEGMLTEKDMANNQYSAGRVMGSEFSEEPAKPEFGWKGMLVLVMLGWIVFGGGYLIYAFLTGHRS